MLIAWWPEHISDNDHGIVGPIIRHDFIAKAKLRNGRHDLPFLKISAARPQRFDRRAFRSSTTCI